MIGDVRTFHRHFGIPGASRPTALLNLGEGRGAERIRHLREELDELAHAAETGDLAAQADALADIVYVALGTAVMMALPFEEVWEAVHDSNMAKEPDPTGRKLVRKPMNWRSPRLAIGHAIGRAIGRE